MRRLGLLVLVAACGGSQPRSVVRVAVIAPDAAVAPDAAEPDAPDKPVGAVALPDPDKPPPLQEVDTTVTDAELPAGPTGWARVRRVARGDRQLVAVYMRERKLYLGLIEYDHGVVEQFPLGATDGSKADAELTGEDFTPRDRLGDYTGPILFALRVRDPKATTWRQVVVFAIGPEIHVVERPVGGSAWTRRLRVELDASATFVAIGTTDPH
jgi:hypothetical protein